jgi:hypothetical protein
VLSRPERSWSPSWCVLQRAADIFSKSNDSDRGLGGLQGQDHRPVSVNSAELHLACSFVAWFPLLMCPPRLSTVDRGLLEPLTRACVRGLLCFLVVCCAPSRAAHASAHICGVGSDRSRVRSRYVCVPCKRCIAGCLGTKSGTVQAHFGPMT